MAGKRRNVEVGRIHKRLQTMVEDRDKVARNTLQDPQLSGKERLTMEQAKEIEAMTNEVRETSVRCYALKIYAPIRRKHQDEGMGGAQAKKAAQRGVEEEAGGKAPQRRKVLDQALQERETCEQTCNDSSACGMPKTTQR